MIILISIAISLTIFLAKCIYNAYLHPLRQFPGPILHKVTRMAYVYRLLKGRMHHDILTMHEHYGDIVRIAPDELSFSHPDAWNDIMGHKRGDKEMAKAPWFYRTFEDEALNISNESREMHGQLRRQLAHGFSDLAMRTQEPAIRGYVELLLQRLRKLCEDKQDVNISDWLTYTTFDIFGDLAFGEPLGCLESGESDDWIKSITQLGRTMALFQSLGFIPWLKSAVLMILDKPIRREREKHKRRSEEKLLRRMANPLPRHDLMEGLLKKRKELNLRMGELISNAQLLLAGGAETASIALIGFAYLVLKSPTAYQRVAHEVRSAFKTQDEITFSSLAQLSYMTACMNETLRVYPPACNGLPRVVPKEGAWIAGRFIPGNTSVAIHHWALYHRAKYFADPDTFQPERFLGAPEFASDQRDAFQPFHVGPRNCIGRNLVYNELRLIFALLFFNFDLKLLHEDDQWLDQRFWLLWERPPLRYPLLPRFWKE